MTHPLDGGFRLGSLRVDPGTGEIRGPAASEKLDPKVMAVFTTLAERANQVVSREELFGRIWPGVVVTDEALSRCIYELRRQLGQAGGSEEFRLLVETLPKRGYRLNGEVTPIKDDVIDAPSAHWLRRIGWVAAGLAILAVAYLALRPDGAATGPAGNSIAVLPFADMSETQDQAYLGDGFAEEILDKLNQSPDLRVIARTSSFVFRGNDADIAEIARKLGVTHVLEGSVRRSGNDLRVTAQLIEAADSAHVWSSTYQRKLGDLFTIQDEIATAVASALRATLASTPSNQRHRPNLKAYDLVKKGEYLYDRRAPGDIEQSIALFEQAVAIDPAYARAWAVLAGAYSFQAWAVDPPSELLRAKQGDAAFRAVELDPTLGIAHARLAQYYYEAGDDAGRHKHHELALKADPDDPLVLGYRAGEAADVDDFGTAIALQKRALLRDPLNTTLRQNLGVMLLAGGRLDEAFATYTSLAEINPHVGPDTLIELSRILALQGRPEEAWAAALQLPAGKYQDQSMALLVAARGHADEANAALGRLEAYTPAPPLDTPEHTIMDSVRLAEIYAFRGQSDLAFSTLSAKLRSLQAHPEATTYTWYFRHESRLSPFLRPLNADPRWAALMGKRA